MKNWIIACLLVVFCVVGILCEQASAAQVIAGEEYNGGYNVSWSLTDDGVLTISSPRNLDGNADYSQYPWKPYSNQVKKIVITGNTESIGSGAFSGMTNVEEVVFNGKLETIRPDVFAGCISLHTMELPNGLEEIGDRAFSGCSSLQVVNFPDSVEQIGEGAFADCSSLQQIKLPNNSAFTEIEDDTFAGCALTELVIPDQVRILRTTAFDGCCDLTFLRIGKNVEIMNVKNFTSSKGLERIEIYCSDSANFSDMPNLKSVVLGPNANYASFPDCAALEDVTLVEGVSSISQGIFRGCTSLKQIKLPSTLLYIGDQAFYNCPIEEIELPDTVQSIGEEAFCNCPLETIELPDSLQSIGSLAFEGTRIKELTIPASVTKLYEDALLIATLEKILFLGDAPKVDSCAMTYFAADGYYPAGNATWTEESKRALGYAIRWESYCTQAEDRVHAFGDWEILTAPTDQGPGEMKRSCTTCGMVEQRTIHRLEEEKQPLLPPADEPVTVPSIPDEGLEAGTCGPLAKWRFDPASGTLIVSGEGIVENHKGIDSERIRCLVFEEGITQIGRFAFQECKNLETVIFPQSLQVIRESAFERCDQLKKLAFPNGLRVLSPRAFYGCDNLETISFGSQLRSIGWDCFYLVGKIEILCLPDSLLYLGDTAFYGCESLQQVSLGSGLGYIGTSAFESCSSLQNIYVSNDNRVYMDLDGVLLTLDEQELLFYPRGRQGEYTVPETIRSIHTYAFQYSDGLTAIHIPGNVKTIGEEAFLGCKALSWVDMAEGVESIGNSAFDQCYSLRTMTIPASIKQISHGGLNGMYLEQLIFLGDRPQQSSFTEYFEMTVGYYPSGNPTWAENPELFGGMITWKEACAGEHVIVVDPQVDADCLRTGLTKGTHCEKCGMIFQFRDRIELTDHVFGDWQVLRQPTVSETGWEERACMTCGKMESNILPTLLPEEEKQEDSGGWGMVILVVVGALVGGFIGWRTHREIYGKRKGEKE